MKYKVKAVKVPFGENKGKVLYYPASTNKPEVININRLAREIEDLSSLSRGDILNVLSNLEKVAINHLREGHSVKLGDLGSFRTAILGKSAETAKEVTAANVSRIRIAFTPSTTMKKEINPGAITLEKMTESEE